MGPDEVGTYDKEAVLKLLYTLPRCPDCNGYCYRSCYRDKDGNVTKNLVDIAEVSLVKCKTCSGVGRILTDEDFRAFIELGV